MPCPAAKSAYARAAASARKRDQLYARGRAGGGVNPKNAITFFKSFQTSPFAAGFRSKYAGW